MLFMPMMLGSNPGRLEGILQLVFLDFLVGAAYITQYYLEKPKSFNRHLTQPLNAVITEDDRTFLRNYLTSAHFKKTFTIIDVITKASASSTNSSSGTVSTNLRPLISPLRPPNPVDRGCLTALNEAWVELEDLLARVGDEKYPEARELYDMLSDDHIRELLVAVDDVGNFRYTSYIDADAASIPVYVEAEPPFVPGEKETSEGDGTLERPFSVVSLPEDEPLQPTALFQQDLPSNIPAIRQINASGPCYTNGAAPRHNPSTIPPQSPPEPLTPSPIQSSPRYRKPSGSPREGAIRRRQPDVVPGRPYNSLGRRAAPGRSRHALIPSYLEKGLPEPGKLRTIRIAHENLEEPLGISVTNRSPSPTPPARSGSLISLRGRQNTPETKRGKSKVVIQRIMVGSLADRDGKLFPGDELLELNGVPVNTIDCVQLAMRNASRSREFQLMVKTPGLNQLKSHAFNRNRPEHKVYIRCLFAYDPAKDERLPRGNPGLAFQSGEVLELVDAQDLNWWQVRRLDPANGTTGLVPSQVLEEKRQAENQQKIKPDGDKKLKKIKTLFRAADSSNLLVRSDLWVYEEVVPWPPSPVHTLLLVGPNGVGRRNLKFLLCTHYPQRFAFPISDTTDATASPALFRIRSKDDMEKDIRQGAFVEWGTVGGHHYGIRFAALREIIATGRTAVVDCQCQSVHLLHQPEFNPHVVLISAPDFDTAKAMMETGIRENLTTNIRSDDELREVVEQSKVFASRNQHLFTHTLVNSNMAEGVTKLSRLIDRLEKQSGWIPAGWAYEMSMPVSPGGNVPGGFLPGASTLSGLGIHGFPQDAQSALGRASNSVISANSPESAQRLARPPSVCSSLQPQPPLQRSTQDGGDTAGRQQRYEKRVVGPKTPDRISSLPVTGVSGSVPPKDKPYGTERSPTPYSLGNRPANRVELREPGAQKQALGGAFRIRLPIKPNTPRANEDDDDDDDDDISTTSSEADEENHR